MRFPLLLGAASLALIGCNEPKYSLQVRSDSTSCYGCEGGKYLESLTLTRNGDWSDVARKSLGRMPRVSFYSHAYKNGKPVESLRGGYPVDFFEEELVKSVPVFSVLPADVAFGYAGFDSLDKVVITFHIENGELPIADPIELQLTPELIQQYHYDWIDADISRQNALRESSLKTGVSSGRW